MIFTEDEIMKIPVAIAITRRRKNDVEPEDADAAIEYISRVTNYKETETDETVQCHRCGKDVPIPMIYEYDSLPPSKIRWKICPDCLISMA
jgi:hypothetical protein